MKTLLEKLRPYLAAMALCTATAASLAADKLPVMASSRILADLVRVVGGERAAVTTLVGLDEDAHVFEPKTSDAKNLLQTRLLVTNGLGFKPWAQILVKSSGHNGPVAIASQGINTRTMPTVRGKVAETDPHAWQDPTNVVIYVSNIATALSQLDSVSAASYLANSEAYIKQLQALDGDAKKK